MTQGDHIREEIIDVLEEGRANPALIRDEVDEIENAQEVQSHIRTLAVHGKVRKVARGLYELADGGDGQ